MAVVLVAIRESVSCAVAVTVWSMTNSTLALERMVGTKSIDVAYDAGEYHAQLHLWVEGVAMCGAVVDDPVVFTTMTSAVGDICCVRCDRALRARTTD